jgi:putative phosphoesterase
MEAHERAAASVAVISDTHGNLPALDAVLGESGVAFAERVVVTGDHVAGPQPKEVLDRLRSLGDRALLLGGNADREVVNLARGGDPAGVPEESVWAASQLSGGDIELLEGLPHSAVLRVSGFGLVLFCHATPRDDEELVLVDSRMERWEEVFTGIDPKISTVVCGHTHMPFLRLVDRRLVLNPGSVGMPYGRPGASWLVLSEGNVTFGHTDLDVDEVAQEILAASGYPDSRRWVHDYVLNVASDIDALGAFGPRDGR